MAKKLKLGIDLINAIKELVSGLPNNGVIGYDDNGTIPGGYEEIDFGLATYSTDELEYGKWIDDSTIYKKTMYYTSGWSVGNPASMYFTSLGANKILKYEGCASRADGTYHCITPMYYGAGGSNGWLLSMYDVFDNSIRFFVGSNFTGNKALNWVAFTIYYTKS
jgi:hypothetical protein